MRSKLANWEKTKEASGATTAGAAGAAEHWKMCTAETAAMATGGAAAIGAKAAAEAESVTHGAPSGKRPEPAQRESWKTNTKRVAQRKRW